MFTVIRLLRAWFQISENKTPISCSLTSHLWDAPEASFLCCSELRWPPQTSGTTCPTFSASETRSGSAPLV